MRIAVVTPIYEDWESFSRLVRELDQVFAEADGIPPTTLVIIGVDDGSIDDGRAYVPEPGQLRRVSGIEMVRLSVRMGHQRAIALGCVRAWSAHEVDAVVVMDADGEDRPQDVPRLVVAHRERPRDVILARRDRRSESLGFRTGYLGYRMLYRLLTGNSIRFGNFSLVPPVALSRLVSNADVWNHFAAAVDRSRLPVTFLSTERGSRYAGHSHMNWVSLLVHGLSAMSVHSDRVAARMILGSAFITVGALIALGVVVYVRLFTPLAIPGWATAAAGILGLASLQSVATASLLSFITLQGRQRRAFLPRIDGLHYIQEVEPWYGDATGGAAADGE